MMDDYRVSTRSAKDIEAITLAWRDTLGVADQWSPDVIRILETDVPKIFRAFALVVRPDAEMADAEGYTEFDPPQVAVRASVYRLAKRGDGRRRMIFAQELGHLVMNPGLAKK